jgi:hypothetical protein
LNGFEFGVNINLTINPNKVLQSVILHKSFSGNWKDEKHNYKEFKYKNYSVKFYNKSELANVESYRLENILRIEVSIHKMKHIKKIMPFTKLSDLLDADLWERFETLLIETIQDCLIIDFTDDEICKLSDKERIKYGDYINTDYWHELYKQTRKNRNKYKRLREECDEFISEHSRSNLKNDITNSVQVKCRELRDISTANKIEKKWYKLPTFEITHEAEKRYKLPTFENEQRIEEWYKLPCMIREEFVPTGLTGADNVKQCKGCGRAIINPSKFQLYCSAKVVGYNEAHKCRNNNSNIRNNTKRSIRRVLSIPLLFDMTDYIAPEKRMYL